MKRSSSLIKSPTVLIILDGYGYSTKVEHNAIAQANKPFIDYLAGHYPSTFLNASGTAVGLPEGYSGNSEVGHLTIGAGRIIPSPFLYFSNSIKNHSFIDNDILATHLKELAATGKRLHILGLLSDAGNHCHSSMFIAMISAAKKFGIKETVIHAFLDGRDVPPQSAEVYLFRLWEFIKKNKNTHLGSMTGRYFAMDRNNNWDRTAAAFSLLTKPNQIIPFRQWQDALHTYYQQKITDEFIPPTLFDEQSSIMPGDGIVFINFREDRARQLSACFLSPDKTPLHLPPLSLEFFISAIRYSKEFTNPVLYEFPAVFNTLKEVISAAGKTIISVAETEKYAHITYFFNGSKEAVLYNEQRILIPSHSLKRSDPAPEMSAQEITQAVLTSLQTTPADFYLINYANADMIGHSGDMKATIKAIEILDQQLEELYSYIVKKLNGILYITADHGNAELMYDEKLHQPYTGHTDNKVPFIYVKNEAYQYKIDLPLQGLADIAPFILSQMLLPIPQEMNPSAITNSFS